MAEVLPSTEALLERLGASDVRTQRSAHDEAIRRLPGDRALRTALLDVLRGGAPRARFAAAAVLFRAERPDLRLLPALLGALELDDGDLRWSAAHMLAALGRLQGEVFPVLLHEAAHADHPVRRRMAVYALRELAPERPATAEAFLAALDDPEPQVRRAALSSLAKLDEPSPVCLERALAALRSEGEPELRRIAAVLLPGLLVHHPGADGEVRFALAQAAASDDPPLVRAATLALSRLSGAPHAAPE